MARQRHLPNAPVTEALIDMQFVPRDGVTFSDLQGAVDSQEFGYYVKSPIYQGTFQFKMMSDGNQPQTTGESAQVGLRLHSHDERYVAQCRLSGFTLSRLPPYQTWTNLIEELRRLWEIYIDRLRPARVTRIATRFINNLRLPLEHGGSYQTYLHKLVDVPDGVPQAVASFFQRFQLVDIASGAQVNLTLALDAAAPGAPAPVILDIDAFAFVDLDPASQELWNILEQLRALKNRSFFGTITEQAAELYQ